MNVPVVFNLFTLVALQASCVFILFLIKLHLECVSVVSVLEACLKEGNA